MKLSREEKGKLWNNWKAFNNASRGEWITSWQTRAELHRSPFDSIKTQENHREHEERSEIRPASTELYLTSPEFLPNTNVFETHEESVSIILNATDANRVSLSYGQASVSKILHHLFTFLIIIFLNKYWFKYK